ncbi:uncharacterized protein LOC114800932 isoform X2 [Denticeps clupeoides]|uniref:uncharacterized protein LOC114800272 isoform X2 n=1 Tax=Denticeps clupeoides TaxID=299321 RepID=UPI0010A3F98D|nr:uncharacterized protein LOC114800272 isoform X2 [Denticeps clupeoides]XP_028854693.1 uncharacterized protein LOC114800932 isoform X2 [Denticeps clupeoides]
MATPPRLSESFNTPQDSVQHPLVLCRGGIHRIHLIEAAGEQVYHGGAGGPHLSAPRDNLKVEERQIGIESHSPEQHGVAFGLLTKTNRNSYSLIAPHQSVIPEDQKEEEKQTGTESHSPEQHGMAFGLLTKTNRMFPETLVLLQASVFEGDCITTAAPEGPLSWPPFLHQAHKGRATTHWFVDSKSEGPTVHKHPAASAASVLGLTQLHIDLHVLDFSLGSSLAGPVRPRRCQQTARHWILRLLSLLFHPPSCSICFTL